MSEQTTAGPSDLVVRVEMGNEFVPSARLKAALDELSAALADEETDEVAGYQFGVDAMGLGMTPGPAEQDFRLHIGCVRLTPRIPCGVLDTFPTPPRPSGPGTQA